MIEFENLVIGYHGRALMHPFSFAVKKGEFFGLIGPNGAGKTTLLKTLIGGQPPIAGSVTFTEGRRPTIGYVPQRDAVETILPLSAREVVAMGLRSPDQRGRNRAARDESVARALDRLKIANLASKPYRDLSGGQRQRTLFARALVSHPDLLIFDEPTNGMDLPSERDTLDLIANLRRELGCTAIIVTHLLSSVAPYVTRVAFIDRERNLFEVDDAARIFQDDRLSHLYGRPMAVARAEGVVAVVAR